MKIILVESKNDKAFYNYLIKYVFDRKMLVEEIEVKKTCEIQDMRGKDDLKTKLKEVKTKYQTSEDGDENKITVGVIVDRDDDEVEDRKQWIQKSFDDVFEDIQEKQLVVYVFDDNYKEVEYYLKTKKIKDSAFADCIFQDCNKHISEKDLMKEWVRLYLKNACDKKIRKQSVENCFFEKVFECGMADKFFDLKADDLPSFGAFLKKF